VKKEAPSSPASTPPSSQPAPHRLFGFLSLSHTHSAFSATVLLGLSSLVSGLLALVRTKYISYVFGAGSATDAYTAAFQLPDMIGYFLVGGVASITLVNILSRHREAGDDRAGDEALSVVLMGMVAVLGLGIVLAELAAPFYVHHFFPSFDGPTSALCIHLTRLLLPAQLFFFAGGVLGSRLLVRKVFFYQALTPILYNLGIILGGVFLARRIGIDSLAWGVLAGSFLGAAVINAVGAFRSGMHFTPLLNLRHPAFVEWLKLSLPLMVGVSLVMADKWLLSYFASADRGGIYRLNVAKTLFNSPLSIIGVAAGAASLPFFSTLYAQRRMQDFNLAVCRSVSRLLSIALLVSAWLFAFAVPIVDLFKGGSFLHSDALVTARYLAIFALSMALWSAQGLYARAFYAAENTFTPALSGTIVTVLSIPVYWGLFHRFGVDGLAFASDLGILAHTVALAVLLHRARLVSLRTLEWGEIARAAAASLGAIAAGYAVASRLPGRADRLGSWLVHSLPSRMLHTRLFPSTEHISDLLILAAGTAVWALVAWAILVAAGSRLPAQILRRKTA
jgi:putative peptidoglycan lipid II flippase